MLGDTLARSACARCSSRTARAARPSTPAGARGDRPARPIDGDPTGAGDAFATVVRRRAQRGLRARPRAARRATAVVGVAARAPMIARRRHRRGRLRGRPRGGRARRRGQASLAAAPPLALNLPRLVAAAAAGSTVVAVVDTKPPLVVSHDAGATWRESGRGLPAGTRRRGRPRTTPTSSSTRRATASTSRATAARSGRRSPSSCPRSKRVEIRS